jgi:AraC family transcriptional regulator
MTDLPDPEIVASDGQTFVGLADSFDMTRRGEIPALYARFAAARDGIEGAMGGALYGLSLDAKPDGTFRYAVAVEVPVPGVKPDGFCVLQASAGPYAVFRQRTVIADLPARFDAIFSNWLPAAPFSLRAGAVFERYPDDDAPEDGKMLYEIWVPVAPA